MRDSVVRRVRRLRSNWIWPLALLALPACGYPDFQYCDPVCFNVDPGPEPRSSVVFCQIEKPEHRHCASAQEIADLDGLTVAAGAIALVTNQSGTAALDYSPSACDPGVPQVVEFEGPFPDGFPVCVNCAAAAGSASDALAVCIAKCEDLTAPGVVPADAATESDCVKRTHLAINASDPFCFAGACTNAGEFLGFSDPRRIPEPVIWKNQVGVDDGGGNTLTRSAPNPTGEFDAGADSGTVVVNGGDAYVEFTASGPDATRVAGFSEGTGDTETNFAKINFAISLFKEGCYYVYESGDPHAGTDDISCSASGAFGTFASGDKFRVSLKDNLDPAKTATVTYSKVTASCATQIDCPPFYTSVTPAHYPLRVDTSFREQNGELGSVVFVRIK
jgi:hypothetical protein